MSQPLRKWSHQQNRKASFPLFCLLLFFLFLPSMGWLCEVGIFGLIECPHSLPALHSGLQNNNNNNNSSAVYKRNNCGPKTLPVGTPDAMLTRLPTSIHHDILWPIREKLCLNRRHKTFNPYRTELKENPLIVDSVKNRTEIDLNNRLPPSPKHSVRCVPHTERYHKRKDLSHRKTGCFEAHLCIPWTALDEPTPDAQKTLV